MSSPDSSAGVRGWPEGQFGLVWLFYACALIGSALALMGCVGTVPAALILCFWFKVIVLSRWPVSNGLFVFPLVLVAIGCWLISSLFSPIVPAYGAARSATCQSNLKAIGVALHAYHSTYGRFPPAFVEGKDGKPWHSWRVLILPHVGEAGLYARYRFDEPWNGPHNGELSRRMPDVFAFVSPNGRGTGKTAYAAIVGQRTMWPGRRSTTIDHIRDGTTNCLAVVEVGASDIDWLEPRDITQSDLIYWLSPGNEDAVPTGFGHSERTFFYDRSWQLHVLRADGSPEVMVFGQDPAEMERRCDISDGQFLTQLGGGGGGYARPRWENWYRVGLFVFLALLPAPWAIWKEVFGISEGGSSAPNSHAVVPGQPNSAGPSREPTAAVQRDA